MTPAERLWWLKRAIVLHLLTGVYVAGYVTCGWLTERELSAAEALVPTMETLLSVSERAAEETEGARTMLREVPTCSPPARMVPARATEEAH
jgi:hypothetical protein